MASGASPSTTRKSLFSVPPPRPRFNTTSLPSSSGWASAPNANKSSKRLSLFLGTSGSLYVRATWPGTKDCVGGVGSSNALLKVLLVVVVPVVGTDAGPKILLDSPKGLVLAPLDDDVSEWKTANLSLLVF